MFRFSMSLSSPQDEEVHTASVLASIAGQALAHVREQVHTIIIDDKVGNLLCLALAALLFSCLMISAHK